MRARRLIAAGLTLMLSVITAAAGAKVAGAQSYQRISGEGSTWAQGALDDMRVAVKQFGISVDYSGTGSTSGRNSFIRGIVDFASSDIPFQFRPEDGSAPEKPAPGSYAYMPITAGGTAFMYNLKINGKRVTNLRLSGETVAKIFTGVITSWSDPALAADNPGLTLPNRRIVPVVRSEGSGSTAQFTGWMVHQHGRLWTDYCRRAKRAPACGATSFYPTISGMIAQAGDLGVSAYVSNNQGEGAIGYVNYSYALGVQFPVAKVLNRAGFYTEPTPENVAVSLLRAKINNDQNSSEYLTQQLDGVYTDTDPRNYQLSSYSYLILPTKVLRDSQFNEQKGKTLGAFSYYAMCQAQQRSASLGYSPMPVNLVEASFEQIRKIPGAVVQDIDIRKCKNPTFSSDGTNTLAKNAPRPQECDKRGPSQCATGTGGARRQTTAVNPAAAAGGHAPRGSTASRAAAGTGGAVGGGGGTGETGTTGGTTTAAAGSALDAAAPVCDPATGDCSGATAGGGSIGDLAPIGDATLIATPTVLGGAAGWGGAQAMMLIVSLLTLALVLGPAAAWRQLSRQAGSR